MALVLQKPQSADQPLTFELHPGVTTIGRAEGNTHVIPDPSVSSSHCQVTVGGEQVIFQDLGSTNGSFIDGSPVNTDPVYITPGISRVKLGSVQVNLVLPGQQRVAIPAASARAVAAAPAPAAAIPLEAVPCKRHKTTMASYYCRKCAKLYCHLCTDKQRIGTEAVRYCKVCASKCEEVESAKANRVENLSTSKQIASCFQYPLKSDGILLLVLGSMFFSVLSIAGNPAAGGFGLVLAKVRIIMLFAGGYFAAYLQKIIHSTMDGMDNLPDWPEFSDWGQDIVHPFKLMVMTSFLVFAPAFVVLILMFFGVLEPGLMAGLLIGGLFVLSSILYPMALLSVAVEDSLAGLNPGRLFSSVANTAKPYFMLLISFYLIGGVGYGLKFALDLVAPWYISIPFVSLFSFYFVLVQIRLLGIFYRKNEFRLNWF